VPTLGELDRQASWVQVYCEARDCHHGAPLLLIRPVRRRQTNTPIFSRCCRRQLPSFKVRGQWRFKCVDIDRRIEQEKKPARVNWGAVLPTSLSSEIEEVLPKIQDTYYKLVLAVGPARTGKTVALIELAAKHNWPRLNVNLAVSEKLLELTHRQRAVRVAEILHDVIRLENSDVVLLDNIELLFATELAQDPLKLLQSVSRNRAIIAAWPGNFDGTALTYGRPGHGEAKRYPTPQAVIVASGEADQPDIRSPGEKTK
jgi:hypothetical protein